MIADKKSAEKEIEELPHETNLFKTQRKEGTVIKQGDTYWEYIIDYESCEKCDFEQTSRGWKNVTHIVRLAVDQERKEITDGLEWFKGMIEGAKAQHEAILMTYLGKGNEEVAKAHINAYEHTLKRIDELQRRLCSEKKRRCRNLKYRKKNLKK